MTILSAAQSAGIRLLGRKPASLFSADDTFGLELGELATEAAEDIVDFYDWQKLKTLQTHFGDGSLVGFDLADDYRRMLKDGEVHSATWQGRPFHKVEDENEWIYLQQVAQSGTPGSWIILGGQMQIFPAMAAGENARYYYISANIVGSNTLVDDVGNTLIDEQGNSLIANGAKQAFSQDDDVFVLSERLLTLSLIWRWRAQKRMEYSEDLTNYETALATAAGSDKGARILVVGRQRPRMRGLASVYPGRILGP